MEKKWFDKILEVYIHIYITTENYFKWIKFSHPLAMKMVTAVTILSGGGILYPY